MESNSLESAFGDAMGLLWLRWVWQHESLRSDRQTEGVAAAETECHSCTCDPRS